MCTEASTTVGWADEASGILSLTNGANKIPPFLSSDLTRSCISLCVLSFPRRGIAVDAAGLYSRDLPFASLLWVVD